MRKIFILFVTLCIFTITGCATGADVHPRFDGLYYRQYESITKYLRFFEDGRVINANTDGRFDTSITEWFDDYFTENQGTYSVNGNRIEFYVESEDGRVEYRGRIRRAQKRLNLNMFSLINFNRQRFTFTYNRGV